MDQEIISKLQSYWGAYSNVAVSDGILLPATKEMYRWLRVGMLDTLDCIGGEELVHAVIQDYYKKRDINWCLGNELPEVRVYNLNNRLRVIKAPDAHYPLAPSEMYTEDHTDEEDSE